MNKFNIHLVNQIVSYRKQNFFRYYIAMRLVDEKNSGYVLVDQYIETVSQKFNVTPKTIKNKLWQVQSYGWGNLHKNRFYYLSQDKLFEYIENTSTLAVNFGWEHICDLQTARAYFYEATLVTKKNEVHISRESIHNKTGHTRKTQRKYEAITGIKKRFNYAALGKYRGPDQIKALTYEECPDLFLGTFEGETEVFRQIPNTYYHNLTLGKRRINPHSHVRRGNEYVEQVFYSNEYNGNIPENTFTHKKGQLWYRQY